MSGATVPYLRRRAPRAQDSQRQATTQADVEQRSQDPATTVGQVAGADQVAGHMATISLKGAIGDSAPKVAAMRAVRARGMIRLDRARPMVALNRFQSAIGVMQVIPELGGRGIDVAWELTDGRNGTLKDIPTDPGRRPLVSWDPTFGFVVGLRHILGVRRLVFCFPTTNAVTLKLFDGTRVGCPREMRALALYRLGDRLYVRSDSEPYMNVSHLRASYGMAD